MAQKLLAPKKWRRLGSARDARKRWDYATLAAQTIYGKIGVKVWICHGEVFGRKDKLAQQEVVSERTKHKISLHHLITSSLYHK